LRQLLLLKYGEEFIDRKRRVSQGQSLVAQRFAAAGRGHVELVVDEVVRMNDINPICSQGGLREILQVEGHDRIGVAANRRRQNVPVIGIREPQAIDETFITGDLGIPDMGIHEVTDCDQLFLADFSFL
jgi:hypothetical protein